MTERIDLDDMDAAEEQDDEEERPNRGDWFWKGEGDLDDEPGAGSWRGGDESKSTNDTSDAADATTPVGTADAAGTEDAGASGTGEDTASADESDTDADTDADIGADGVDAGSGSGSESEPHRPTASPHVPSDTAGTPAGIPVSRGGGGAGSGSRPSEAAGGDSADPDADAEGGGESGTEPRASGPHGGGADDMTTAFTYRAAKRLANPAAAFADAEQWSDWIGIVGDVKAHVLGAFQRNETIDADFFNGSGTGPAERLAGIDAHSMFYADRMVVVGVEGDEFIAEEAGWEFVPLEDAASGAGWDLVDPDDETESGADADAGR